MHRLVISVVLLAGVAACGAEPVQKVAAQPAVAAKSVDSGTAAGEVDSTQVPTQVPTQAPTQAPSRRRNAADSSATQDSSPPRINVPMLPGRSRRDSVSLVAAMRAGERANWPTPPAPLPGSFFPQRRIVAFYGNPLSPRMGALGEGTVDEMLARLDRQVAEWNRADPAHPVQPALHLIAVVAQGAPGRDGKYRLRMDSTLIERVYGWAQRRDALLFLDIQVGQSTVQEELPRLLRFLERPNVHLGLDPEFSMHGSREGMPPGRLIGTMRAEDINYAVRTLSNLVTTKRLPPKILIVHRFTRSMVTNARQITIDPRVQVVMDMDGWGAPWLKFDSYAAYIVREPVQFTGFKLFFHNDTKKGHALLTPAEVLRLKPAPLYIQYQ